MQLNHFCLQGALNFSTMVQYQDVSELPNYPSQATGWLSKTLPMTYRNQILAYRVDLKIGYGFCTVCRTKPLQVKVESPSTLSFSDDEEVESVSECAFKAKVIHASYGFVKNRPTRCARHKLPDMEIVEQMCPHNTCRRRCFECLGGRVCKYHSESLCETLGSVRYQGYCARCFSFLFPDQPVARHFCIKERHVLDFIRETLPDLPWVMNKTVQGGCSRRRPDITLDRGTFRLIVEVDENQHRGYSCENRRLMELFQDGGNVPLVLIRLNPDAYTSSEGTRVPSCFSVSESGSLTVPSRHKKQWEHRLLVLLSYLNTILSTTTCEREITIEELFYDGSPRPSAD
jgi:hypothetical protein